MSNNTLFYLLSAVLVGMGLIFVLNFMTIIQDKPQERILDPNQVSGSAVEYKGKLYTLNFAQQKELVYQFNRAIMIGDKNLKSDPEKPNITRILIYRFDQPPIEIAPLAFVKNRLVFSAPEWHEEKYLWETGIGSLKDLLPKTHDP